MAKPFAVTGSGVARSGVEHELARARRRGLGLVRAAAVGRQQPDVLPLADGDGAASPFSGGTLVGADGTRTRLEASDVELTPLAIWTSERTGVRYPSPGALRRRSAGIDSRDQSRTSDQELDLSVRYWEGAVRVGRARARRAALTGAGLSRARGVLSFLAADDITRRRAVSRSATVGTVAGWAASEEQQRSTTSRPWNGARLPGKTGSSARTMSGARYSSGRSIR